MHWRSSTFSQLRCCDRNVFSAALRVLPLSGELKQLAAEGGHLKMTETNPPKSAKKLRWSSLEVGLITIVSLLFIVIVALIILFATQKSGEFFICEPESWILDKQTHFREKCSEQNIDVMQSKAFTCGGFSLEDVLFHFLCHHNI